MHRDGEGMIVESASGKPAPRARRAFPRRHERSSCLPLNCRSQSGVVAIALPHALQIKSPGDFHLPACSSRPAVGLTRLGDQCITTLRAAEAFTAVQTLVTGAVPHGHVAAVGTRGRVLLKMGNGVAQGCNRPSVD